MIRSGRAVRHPTRSANEALGKPAGDAAEDTSEQAARTKFMATKTTNCAACNTVASIASFVDATVDGANSLVYSGSPSGPS
jgi:hypothetical protein